MHARNHERARGVSMCMDCHPAWRGPSLRGLVAVAAGVAIVPLLIAPVFGEPAQGTRTAGSDAGPVVGPMASALDSLLPRASGVFLAQVTRISQYDERPSDGDLYDKVWLRVLRSTGETLDALYLVRDFGGYFLHGEFGRRPPPRRPPPFHIAPDELSPGRQYWFATAAPYDEFPERIVRYWAADSAALPPRMEQAVAQDAYRWRPEYWPNSGFTIGWLEAPGDSARVRAWRTGELLWEQPLAGQMTHAAYGGWYIHSGRELGSMGPPGLPDDAWVLRVEVREALAAGNRFGVPEGTRRITHLIDMETGRILNSRAAPQ